MNAPPASVRKGFAAGLAAYGLWGLVPLYFKAVKDVPPDELLAHRVLWSAVVLAVLLTRGRDWPDVARALRSPAVRTLLLGSTAAIAFNWYFYIHAVRTEQVVQASLGYFVAPLLNVVLGTLFFRERLRRAQWVAVALAAAGVGVLASQSAFPWLAAGLAATFSTYGLLRKRAGVASTTGLSVETFLLAPAALVWLIRARVSGVGTFGTSDKATDGLLAASGLVTTLPLLCFGTAARLLPLSTLGFLQYISPSVQWVLAVWVFGEPVGGQLPGFACVWAGLALYAADSVRGVRRRPAVGFD